MIFNTLQFLKDHHIVHDANHHHASPGWIAVRTCPFCGSAKYHFGIHESSGAANCWKCGTHSLTDSIRFLCDVDLQKAKDVQAQYGTIDPTARRPGPKPKVQDFNQPAPCQLPTGTRTMIEAHRDYLRKRNFDPDRLEREWLLQGVGMVPGNLFSMRIIIPITFRDTVVSYQGRDITGNRDRIRYKTCSKKDETRFHKHCLYGLDAVKGKSVIVTEGVTKVWRLGQGAVATFGIIWNLVQASLLLEMDRVFVLYDKGLQAQDRANRLAYLLAGQAEHTEVIELNDIDDPGDLTQKDADALMRELKIRR